MQEAQRMHPSFVFQVLTHLPLDRRNAGEDVTVGVDDAFGFRGGSRSEDDLERALVSDGGVYGEKRLGGQRVLKVGEGQQWLCFRQSTQKNWIADDHARRHVRDYSCGEGG